MTIDVVIPCYNAAATVRRAAESALRQPEIRHVRLIDDASDDQTWQLITRLAAEYPQIRPERLPDNGGAARARNWGAWQSSAPFIAFLDADDEYEDGALAAAAFALGKFDYLGLVRLRLQATHFPERYTRHPDFARAWQVLAMTVGGNTVFRRNFFLACGGFPQHGLFRSLGGEDGALGIATVQNSVVGTLFEAGEPAVRHHWREGMHAQRLLDAHLFHQHDARISPQHMAQAEAVTAGIGADLQNLRTILGAAVCGTMPLQVSRNP